MPTNLKGPGLFLAQFASDEAPFNSLEAIADWASGLGYKGLQIPSGDLRLFDLDTAASSQTYCCLLYPSDAADERSSVDLVVTSTLTKRQTPTKRSSQRSKK